MSTTRHIATSAALVLSLAAAAAPGASARPAGPSGVSAADPASAIYSRQDKSLVAPDKSPSRSALAKVATVSFPQPNSDFDWVDAGIGAAGGIALSAAGLGISQRRARRTRQTTALTN